MSTVKYTPRLADKYTKDVIPALMKKFAYKTVMQAPKLEKICINRGVNGAVTEKTFQTLNCVKACPSAHALH